MKDTIDKKIKKFLFSNKKQITKILSSVVLQGFDVSHKSVFIKLD